MGCARSKDSDEQSECPPTQPGPGVLIIPAAGTHTATVFFLHGLGDTPAGWHAQLSRVAKQLPHIRWVLPAARSRAVTVNGGAVMPAWYDITGLSLSAPEDDEGIAASARQLQGLAAAEGVPHDRVVFAGFSQGGAVALHAALTCPSRIGGAVALSGYLAGRRRLEQHTQQANSSLPVLFCHGTGDMVINVQWGKMSCQALQAVQQAAGGVPETTWRTYPMGHQSCEEELRDFAGFLRRQLPPAP
eukprot:TRINITY_DN47091_c0_g1_i1.p1 TRINITY_DN47091_c0_g1~~TRINITY_DN47091_c0_g1_i1.p1  ORF type:complete len:275 (+),score=53.40 TRINITY_DN47091_c0_g1_i1:93-827(+)